MQNAAGNKTLVRTFLMLAEHFPGPCGPFAVIVYMICTFVSLFLVCVRKMLENQSCSSWFLQTLENSVQLCFWYFCI